MDQYRTERNSKWFILHYFFTEAKITTDAKCEKLL